MRSTASRKRASRRPSSTSIVSPDQIDRSSARAHVAADHHFRRARAAARPGRRHQEGDGAPGRRAVLHLQHRRLLDRGPALQPGAHDATCGTLRRWTFCCSWRRRRRASASTGPAISTWIADGRLREARGAHGRALRLFGRRHHQARTVRRRNARNLLARAILLRGRATRTAARPAPRRRNGCTWARRRRSRRRNAPSSARFSSDEHAARRQTSAPSRRARRSFPRSRAR